MLEEGFDRIIVIEASKGNPSRLIFYKLDDFYLNRKAIFYISGVTFQTKTGNFNSSSLKVKIKKEEKRSDNLCETYSFLKEFLKIILYPSPRGKPCILSISQKEKKLDLIFRDASTQRGFNLSFKVKNTYFE
jgi:rRNA maturation protein Rpf1